MYIVTICVSNERNLTFVDTLYVFNLHFSHSNLANDVVSVFKSCYFPISVFKKLEK